MCSACIREDRKPRSDVTAADCHRAATDAVSSALTLYIVFAALGTLIYIGVACAEAAFSGSAAARERDNAQTCVGLCRTGSEAIVVEASTALPAGFHSAAVRSESARAVA